MVLDISFDLIRSHSVPYGSCKISIFPEFASPQFILDLGELLEDFTCIDALEHAHYPCNGISRREAEKNMYMVHGNFHLFDLKAMVLCNLFQQFPYPIPDNILRPTFDILVPIRGGILYRIRHGWFTVILLYHIASRSHLQCLSWGVGWP